METENRQEGRVEGAREMKISIDTGTFVRAVLVLAAVAIFLMVRDVVLIVLIAVVIAAAINPAVHYIEKARFGRFTLPRSAAVASVYLLILFIFFLFFYFVVPIVVNEISSFLNSVREYSQAADVESLQNIPAVEGEGFSLQQFVLDARQSLSNFSQSLLRFVSTVFGGLLSAVLIIAISFYVSVQRNVVDKFLAFVMPARHSDYARSLWGRTEKKIGQWVQGQLLSGLIVGLVVYIGLLIIGIPYALLFATLAAVLELIPIVGPVLAAIPAIAVAFIEGGTTQGLITLGFYVVVQQLEGNVIYPLVVRKMVGIPPLVVIIAIAIGAALAGFMGVLLAVPVSALMLELLSDLRKRERGEAPPELSASTEGEPNTGQS